MNSPFPFGFPLPTAIYLVLYVLTLVLHVAFMNYVLAGTAWLAFRKLRPDTDSDSSELSPTSILRDWMPFAVSAAITAGVAPLLFLQILYKENFYTANLLLLHRWMAIVPVLIVGFYLTYLIKRNPKPQSSLARRRWIGIAAFACFAFAAYSWTENHLLSINSAAWSSHYSSESLVYVDSRILPRLVIWAVGAFPTMAVLLGWQLAAASRAGSIPVAGNHARRLSLLAAIGLTLAIGCGLLYFFMLTPGTRSAVLSGAALPYLIAAALGCALQFAAWHFVYRRQSLSPSVLTLATAGVAITLIGATIAREAIRIASIEFARLFPQHAHAWSRGGLGVFLFFAVVTGFAIAWCFRIVRREWKAA